MKQCKFEMVNILMNNMNYNLVNQFFFRRLYQFLGSVSKSAEPPMFQQFFIDYEKQKGTTIYNGNERSCSSIFAPHLPHNIGT